MRSVAALLLAATLAALAACSAPAEPPAAAPSPAATPEPIFASDEEALAAAEEAYTEYLRVYDSILNEGGNEPDRLVEVLDGAALEEALDGAAEFRQKKIRSVGTREIVGLRIQSVGKNDVSFYVCEDVTDVDVMNRDGESLVSSDRPPWTPFEAVMLVTESGFRISERVVWSGDGICTG